MRILHVCTEIHPLLKTGGLADVAAALPPALVRLGCEVRMLVPGFPAFMRGIEGLSEVAALPPRFGAPDARLLAGRLPGTGIPAYVIDAPALYDRPGDPYSDANHHAYPDNHLRFALLGRVGAQLAEGLDPGWRPELVHGHDWHAGLMSAYLAAAAMQAGARLAASVFTIHNLAYQGVFPSELFPEFGLPPQFFDMHGLEFHGQVSFLKGGLFYADQLTTVSPTYAREIQRPEQGCGLDGLLAHRANSLTGILNGVDRDLWNPATDPAIAARYDMDDMDGKRACKAALQREMGLAPRADAPLFGMVSRLTGQKGLPLVLGGLDEIVARGGQVVLLGSGDKALETACLSAATRHSGAVAVRIGYDEALSHRIVAGSDVLMVPSLFEPCGLTQLYALRYGTLPLGGRVGGLADTVADCSLENLADDTATGFVFERFEVADFSAAARRAFALAARPDDWSAVQRTAMRQCFDWDAAARRYLAVYRDALG
ncbi:MAG: glycogen synthase GlgA [Burkholderiaceae bacterium]